MKLHIFLTKDGMPSMINHIDDGKKETFVMVSCNATQTTYVMQSKESNLAMHGWDAFQNGTQIKDNSLSGNYGGNGRRVFLKRDGQNRKEFVPTVEQAMTPSGRLDPAATVDIFGKYNLFQLNVKLFPVEGGEKDASFILFGEEEVFLYDPEQEDGSYIEVKELEKQGKEGMPISLLAGVDEDMKFVSITPYSLV